MLKFYYDFLNLNLLEIKSTFSLYLSEGSISPLASFLKSDLMSL